MWHFVQPSSGHGNFSCWLLSPIAFYFSEITFIAFALALFLLLLYVLLIEYEFEITRSLSITGVRPFVITFSVTWVGISLQWKLLYVLCFFSSRAFLMDRNYCWARTWPTLSSIKWLIIDNVLYSVFHLSFIHFLSFIFLFDLVISNFQSWGETNSIPLQNDLIFNIM